MKNVAQCGAKLRRTRVSVARTATTAALGSRRVRVRSEPGEDGQRVGDHQEWRSRTILPVIGDRM